MTTAAKQAQLLNQSVTPALQAYRDRQAAAGISNPFVNAGLTGVTTAGTGLGAGAGVVLSPTSTNPVPGAEMAGQTSYAGISGGGTSSSGLWGDVATLGLAGLGALGVAIPEPITTIIGAGLLGYTALQALGLGQGGGLFNNNLLGGDTAVVGGVTLGGPGLPEPAAQYLEKEWHVKYDWGTLQYYMVKVPGQPRKILLYNTKTQLWKYWTWRKPSLAVIGKNMPSHKMLVRLRRNLGKQSADAKSVLRLVSPGSLAVHHKRTRTRVVYKRPRWHR